MRKISAYSRIAEFIANLIISEGLSSEYKICTNTSIKIGRKSRLFQKGLKNQKLYTTFAALTY